MILPAIQCNHLVKSFAGVPVVNHLSLTIHTGEILSLLGPSGCGKTTTLRLIAGFERPDAGDIFAGQRQLAGSNSFVPAEKRSIGVVFQEYALFPHLNVFDNVSFGLERMSRQARAEIVKEMLDRVGLTGMEKRFPHQLSGGEQQRVALARALAPRPVVLLLDEPFSNLDAELRKKMREDVRAVLKEMKATAVFVTHDQEEALYMGDRVAVMCGGQVCQIGTPEEIFHTPATHFVAEFMGNTDFLPGMVTPLGIQTEIGLIEQHVDLPVGSQVEVAMRADDLTLEIDPDSRSQVIMRDFKGAMNVYRVQLPSGRVLQAFQPHYFILEPGTLVRIWADPGHALACFSEGKAVGERDLLPGDAPRAIRSEPLNDY
jgi:iron(III) transport system ATP-binding protein